MRKLVYILIPLSVIACGIVLAKKMHRPESSFINPSGATLKDRIKTPPGYTRVQLTTGSFGEYLRQLPLKPHGSEVHYYDGHTKPNNNIYAAVVDMPIGHKDLQQCADVIMHVRADYLYTHHFYDRIHFNFTNGFPAAYSKWKDGYRIAVSGNKSKWIKNAQQGTSQASFDQYMDVVYNYCGSLSLSHELKKIAYKDIEPGDVLIKGGTPGHAEIILDVATNAKGEKLYLLAQSYMPAQEMQLLINPRNTALSPWYKVDAAADEIVTPEWTFTTNQAMRFADK